MFKGKVSEKFFIAIMAIISIIGCTLVYADMTDKATLGGQSTTNGVYDWRVDSNGNFIPGTTAQNNIGSSTNQVNTVYAGNFVSAGTSNGSVSQVESVAALPLSYGVVVMPVMNSVGAVYTLANGVPGQVITFTVVNAVVGSDTDKITPATSTGFVSVTLTAVKQSVTLMFVNSSVGWIILGNAGATIA